MCLMVSAVSIGVFTGYFYKNLEQSSRASLNLLSDTINGNINSIYRLGRFCMNNSAVAEYINNSPEPGSVLAVSTYERINEEYTNNPANTYIPRLAIITDAHFLQIVSATYSSTDNLSIGIKKLPYYEQLLSARGYDFSVGFVKDPFYRNGIQVLPVIRPITYQFKGEIGGIVFMEISSDLFQDAFRRYESEDDSDLFLTLNDHVYKYEDGLFTELDALSVKHQNIVTVPLDMPGCSISQTFSESAMRTEKFMIVCIILGTIVIMIGIGAYLMSMFNRMITVPVDKLQKKMNKIADGDFSRDTDIEWEHELGEIGRGINNLSENIKVLMDNRLENEKRRKDLEYKVLQAQVNPHFLYNTLNSIKWMATAQGMEGISEMTTSLAKLLKSISKGTSNIIPIEEELSLLSDYFTIQSYRYGKTIAMNICVEDDSIYKCGIIKFTLQPLVENAIFHGIEPKGSGKIDIRSYYEEGDIVITVTDDGVGMSQENIKRLFEDDSGKEKSAFFKELGVANVNKRLKYEYGIKYGISAESEEGKYTRMKILIPTKKGEDHNV